VSAMEKIITTCRSRNIAGGLFVESLEQARRWVEIGARFLLCSTDVMIFLNGCKTRYEEFKPLLHDKNKEY
jgi:2-keto-3-deoxy-L-rhamnonate aldolase RhmA